MKQICIVDDDPNNVRILKNYVERFSAAENEECRVTVFSDGVKFLDGYNGMADVIFIDIEMPFMNGLTAYENYA